MKVRDALFVAFGIFVALSAAYVAFQLAVDAGLSTASAGPISGLVFTVAVLMIDRASGRHGGT
jgi:hypothetical protein